MSEKKESERPSKKSKKTKTKKIIKWVILAAILILLAVFFLVPVYISSDAGTKMILGKINDSIDGKASLDDLSMGWLRGVKIKNFTLSMENPKTSIAVKQITAIPKYLSLLSSTPSLGKTVII